MKTLKKRKSVNTSTLEAPKILCLYQNAEETTYFLSQLYDKAPVLHIDFSSTEEITAAAALALFAHINNIQQGKNNAGCFVFKCKKSPIFKTHFIQTGLLKALKQGSKYDQNDLFLLGNCHKITEIRARTFKNLDKYKIEFNKDNSLPPDEIETFFAHLKQAIKEALLNVTNHAYCDNEQPKPNGYDHYRDKMWWQMLWSTDNPHRIHFIIYDLGIGIANSYTEYSTKKRLGSAQPLSHEKILQEALKPGMSRMVGEGRGMGLSFIIESIDNLDSSSLFLRTGTSACHLENNKEPEWFNYRHNLTGTLIEWSFQLPIKDK